MADSTETAKKITNYFPVSPICDHKSTCNNSVSPDIPRTESSLPVDKDNIKVEIKSEAQTISEEADGSPIPKQAKETSDVKPKTSARGRGKGKGRKKKTTKSRSESAGSKPKTEKRKAKEKKSAKPSRVLTDYFPVRRSYRMTSADVKKQKQKDLEDAILSERADGLEVVEIEGKGRGVVSTRPFSRGEFVVEYYGELIDLASAKGRESKYSRDTNVGCYMYYFQFNNKNYCVDATAESGKLGRLLNHSRTGNCKTKVVGIGDRPYLILVAARDIEAGEELVYDYGDRNKETLEAHPWLAL